EGGGGGGQVGAGRHVSGAGEGANRLARRERRHVDARALGGVPAEGPGEGPRGRVDRAAVGDRQGTEGRTAESEQLESGSPEGRRLHAPLDQQGRESLPG